MCKQLRKRWWEVNIGISKIIFHSQIPWYSALYFLTSWYFKLCRQQHYRGRIEISQEQWKLIWWQKHLTTGLFFWSHFIPSSHLYTLQTGKVWQGWEQRKERERDKVGTGMERLMFKETKNLKNTRKISQKISSPEN